jgi:Protein of unknown function (DUF3618)
VLAAPEMGGDAAGKIRTWQAEGMNRDPETIQQEIEQTREALAGTLDELAERTSPKRIAERARDRAVAAATSPPGIAVLGAVGALAAFVVVRRIRRFRRER